MFLGFLAPHLDPQGSKGCTVASTDNKDKRMNDQQILIPSRVDKNRVSVSRTTLTPSSDKREKVIYCDPRPCIPVIFFAGCHGD